MAINDIKIKSHDIYLERNGDKGGNLTIGASTTTNSLTVNTTTNNKGGLIVGTSDSPSYLDVYGAINNNGNLTVSGTITGNTLAVGSGGLTVSASTTTNSLTVNTNTINKGNLTVGTSTTQGDIKVYGNILLSGNSAGSISSYNGLTVSAPYITFTTSPNYITFNTPTMVMNTNKISIRSANINVDDFVTYTPSTIPAGMNKTRTYKKECDLNVICNENKTDFYYETKSVSVGPGGTGIVGPGGEITKPINYYKLTISNSLSDIELENLQKYIDGVNHTTKLIVKLKDETTFREISLSTNAISLDSANRTLKIEADNESSNDVFQKRDYDNLASIKSTGKTIEAVTFMAIGDIVGEDGKLSIEQCSTIQIKENKHVLLNCASTGTTNISYFPNTVYNREYQKLAIVTANSVSLNPGDFIEFYPVGGYCYIFCDELSMDTDTTMGSGGGSPGYIYYEPTGLEAYIYHLAGQTSSLDKKPVTSETGSSLLIKFRTSKNSNAGSPCEVIIKR